MTTYFNSKPCHTPKPSYPDSFMNRLKLTERKKDELRVKSKIKEKSNSRSVPKINTISRHIARNSQQYSSQSRMEKTQKVLSNSRFMPKNVKVSLFSLQGSEFIEPVKEKPDKSHFIIATQRTDSPKFYPSLVQQDKVMSKTEAKLPKDIQTRNSLLFEVKNKGFFREAGQEKRENFDLSDINKRSQYWLLKKEEKLKEAKALKEKKIEKISFKIVRKKNEVKGSGKIERNRSCKSLSEIERNKIGFFVGLSRGSMDDLRVGGYENVTPIKMKLGYSHGFSNRMTKKFKPMIDYKVVRLNRNS